MSFYALHLLIDEVFNLADDIVKHLENVSATMKSCQNAMQLE
jgi:hypothetical protein